MTLLHLLTPVGLAVAQVLSLYAANVDELRSEQIVRSLVLAAGLAIAVWAALLPVGGARRAAVVTSLGAILFWGAGDASASVSSASGDLTGVDTAVSVALWAAWGVIAIAILRRRAEPQLLSWGLAAAALGSVGLPLASILSAALAGSADPPPDPSAADAPPPGALTPDLYVLVLDAYGRDDELREFFGIEVGLGQQLEERGFFVAHESHANYTTTVHSLASLLNYDYLSELGGDTMKPRDVYDRIQRSRVVDHFRNAGYAIGNCSSGFTPTSWWPSLDRHIRPPAPQLAFGTRVWLNEFETLLLQRTPIAAFLTRTKFLSPYLAHRARILHCIETLPEIARDPRPTFTFAHVVAPHEPFVFGPNGEDVSPYDQPFSIKRLLADLRPEGDGVSETYAAKYRDQAIYIRKVVVAAVERIVADSPDPPIIVVMGDHGPKGFRPRRQDARFAILNAYRLPEGGEAALYPSITPVNTFRVILSHYLGFSLPLLPDRRFRSDYVEGMEFEEQVDPARLPVVPPESSRQYDQDDPPE